MTSADIRTLIERLTELAELYRVRPPGDRAIRLWFDGLCTFPVGVVADILIEWPRHGRNMPTVAEVYPLCMAKRQGLAQRQAALTQPLRPEPPPAPERALLMADLRAILRRHGAPRDPRAWISCNLARIRHGWRPSGTVAAITLDAARRCGLDQAHESEAEREARLEREAIQSEAAA